MLPIGAGTALITPFTEDGAVDYAALTRLAAWQVAEGMQFVVACGSTGEAQTLTPEERERVVRTVVQAVGGRIPVLAGATDNDTSRAVTPIVILPFRNIALEQQALTAVRVGETYAVVPRGRWIRSRDRLGPLRYLESWLQFQLAPRLQVDPAHADWLILLDGASEPLAAGTTASHTVGDDVLMRR